MRAYLALIAVCVLALPACAKSRAQRNYEKLAARIELAKTPDAKQAVLDDAQNQATKQDLATDPRFKKMLEDMKRR